MESVGNFAEGFPKGSRLLKAAFSVLRSAL